ncbi:MAG: rane protein [Myxococcales bacterium]|nr:rane protein [Myxococcales bacterium]
MTRERIYWALVVGVGAALVGFGAPSWLALISGFVIALGLQRARPQALGVLTMYSLQLGIIALGAGMNLEVVLKIGVSGAALTATGLAIALVLGLVLGRLLRILGDTPLLIAVGTAICGGSAIAAVASAIKPKEHETSTALAVVFMLNAVGLLVFPVIGHALGLSEPVFGHWAALAIHDTSSVVGAGLAYGPIALGIATTTKLGRALWIVPVTIGVTLMRQRDVRLRDVKWPWFILGFVLFAALFTWIPELARFAPPIVMLGKRSLVLALFLIGLSLSRKAIATVGPRPFLLGVILWIVVAAASLPLAMLSVDF